MGNRGTGNKGYEAPRTVCPGCGRVTAYSPREDGRGFVFLRRHRHPATRLWCETRRVRAPR